HPDQTTKTLPTRPRTPTRQPQPATGSPTPSDHQRPPTTQTLNPQKEKRKEEEEEKRNPCALDARVTRAAQPHAGTHVQHPRPTHHSHHPQGGGYQPGATAARRTLYNTPRPPHIPRRR